MKLILSAIVFISSLYSAGPVISAYTLTSASSSELLATWTTDVTATSNVKCGTTSGAYTIISETVNPLARSYSVTSHRMAIGGLLANTRYYCLVTSVSAGGTTIGGTELSAYTISPPRQRVPTVTNISAATRYNDQFGTNGRRSDGDASFCTWAGDGDTYCSHQDGAIINTSTAFDTYIWKWPTSTDTTLTNGISVSAWTNAGTVRDAQNQTYNDGGGAWATNGVYSAWDEASQTSILYNSLYRRILNASLADASILKSPDHGVHWIAPQNNTGPSVVGTLQGDMPTSSVNSMWPGGTTTVSLFAIQNCKDHRDCTNTVANERTYHYFFTGIGNGSTRYLVRSRLENLTLQDPTLIEWYIGARTGDDGNYPAAWSTSNASATAMGTATVDFYNAIVYLPDFNIYFSTAWERTSVGDVTPKGVLIQQQLYPWSAATTITRITPPVSPSGYLPAFANPLLATYVKTGNSPLTATIKIQTCGYITGANFSDPTVDQYSLFNYTVTLAATSGGDLYPMPVPVAR